MKEEVGGWGEGGEMVEWEVLEATELLSLWSGGAAGGLWCCRLYQ